jgi:hypothetical protein
MSNTVIDTDLSALFGIDISQSDDQAPVSVMCGKCNGKGKFISYSGAGCRELLCVCGIRHRPFAGVALQADDCTKCVGSGEYSPGRPCFACNGTGKVGAEVTAAITVERIEQAFAAARNNGVKSPKLRLVDFVFSRAPDTGRNAGSIYVKGSGGTYLGKVTASVFRPVRECDDATTKAGCRRRGRSGQSRNRLRAADRIMFLLWS